MLAQSYDIFGIVVSKFAESISTLFSGFIQSMTSIMPIMASVVVLMLAISFFADVAENITSDINAAVADVLEAVGLRQL